MILNIKFLKNIIRPAFKLLIFYGLYFAKISFSKQKFQKRQIVMIFDGKTKQGGLVDRLKGIISAYEVSKKIDADFKIHFVAPVDLSLFLEPNKVKWIANADDLKWNPFRTAIIQVNNNFNVDLIDLIKKTSKPKIFIFANVDYLQILNANLNDQEVANLWRDNFDELFVQSSYLKEAITRLNIKNDSIAIHTRFTNLLGDFSDSNISEIPEIRKKFIVNSLKEKISTIVKENTNKTIYIFSDSARFLDEMRNIENCCVLEGSPIHLDNVSAGVDTNAVHLKTFIDFFAISNCSIVYFMKTREMYNSSFSKYASILGGKQFARHFI